jgi:hypothetical protein
MVESINSWSARAKCRNSPNDNIFFPTSPAGVAKGRKFCESCPVRELCKAYALVHSLPGIWGGTSEQQREKTNPVLKNLLRVMYQQAGLLESAWIRVEEYQLDKAHLEELPSELSDPIGDAMAG